jgi:hypothetical protein
VSWSRQVVPFSRGNSPPNTILRKTNRGMSISSISGATMHANAPVRQPPPATAIKQAPNSGAHQLGHAAPATSNGTPGHLNIKA